MEHNPESELNQDLVADQSPTPQALVRRRVAEAIRDSDGCGISFNYRKTVDFCNDGCRCWVAADAAIAAHLEALIEMELPFTIPERAEHIAFQPRRDEFRAILGDILRKLQGGAL